MITVSLLCGLGNQLFQYAAARALARHHGVEVRFDNSILEMTKNGQVEGVTPREYELYHFHVKTTGIGSYWPKANQVVVDKAKDIAIFENFFKKPDNSCLVGDWQNYRYAEKLRDEWLDTMRPTKPLSPMADNMQKVAMESESVFIHVRRGDYIRLARILDIDYYVRAMDMIKKEIPQPIFFLFSDDINWAINAFLEKNLLLPADKVYVSQQPSSEGWQDLTVMSYCKHAVIANSSFSWWAAYWGMLRHEKINDKKMKKMVIAPKSAAVGINPPRPKEGAPPPSPSPAEVAAIDQATYVSDFLLPEWHWI
ncbi:MAG: alpha-1,2-fucosyltransferase [Gammaproteobacteria bacterium]